MRAELPFDAAYKLMATFHRMRNDQAQAVIRCYLGGPDARVMRAREDAALEPTAKRL